MNMAKSESTSLGYPEGWFCVSLSETLAPGQVSTRRFFGRDVVMYRTRSGRACVADAYCPHLGAHFAYGGTVEGESLRCPFHGFEFDHQGSCTATGYGTNPPQDARLTQFPVIERNGFVFAWFSPVGNGPTWSLPDGHEGRWLSMSTRTWTLRAHPQETTENSVDIGHLSVIHGYTGIETLSALRTDGPYLHTRYAMQRDAGVFGKNGHLLRAEFDIHAWGVGFSWVDVRVPEYGIHTHNFVLVTPIDEQTSTLTIGLRMEPLEDPGRVHPSLRLLPRPVVNEIIRRGAFSGFAHDVKQDFDIWQNKKYVERPRLATGDGPVVRYRKWTRQFYPAAVD